MRLFWWATAAAAAAAADVAGDSFSFLDVWLDKNDPLAIIVTLSRSYVSTSISQQRNHRKNSYLMVTPALTGDESERARLFAGC